MGQYPTEAQSQRPYLLQPVSVSRAQFDRTVLQQDHAMSARRDPVRQTRSQLSGLWDRELGGPARMKNGRFATKLSEDDARVICAMYIGQIGDSGDGEAQTLRKG
jgi:hypothetical protein